MNLNPRAMAGSMNCGFLFEGVPFMRALLFGLHITAPDFGNSDMVQNIDLLTGAEDFVSRSQAVP